MIECRALTKTFDSVPALDSIDLTVQKGSIYGLAGSNGAGKSTLLRTVSGIYHPDQGEILVDGQNVWENSSLKSRIILVADENLFFSHASIDKMADFYKRFYPGFSRELYESLCTAFTFPRKKPLANLSKGMKRQAAFLLAVSCQPDYLLLDECFDGLDPVRRQAVRKVLSDTVAGRNMTVVISSHNLRELDEICDTVGILHKGKLLYSRDLDNLKGDVQKIQTVFETEIPDEAIAGAVQLMHLERHGRFVTMIVKGSPDLNKTALQDLGALAVEACPLTLEEIFIYEMEVKGYDANIIFE